MKECLNALEKVIHDTIQIYDLSTLDKKIEKRNKIKKHWIETWAKLPMCRSYLTVHDKADVFNSFLLIDYNISLQEKKEMKRHI